MGAHEVIEGLVVFRLEGLVLLGLEDGVYFGLAEELDELWGLFIEAVFDEGVGIDRPEVGGKGNR